VIMISTQHVNMGVFTDPAHLIIESAQAENVDTVLVDGRLLKRGGRLTGLSIDRILGDAESSLEAMRKRANWG
jgi:5-methylthioadenosine/S-adenosylhomocysteine deaminase